MGDARLYQDAADCGGLHGSEKNAERSWTKRCVRGRPAGALLPTVVVGGLTGITRTPEAAQLWLQLFGFLFAVTICLFVFQLARSNGRQWEGIVAVLLLILCTPLLERARAGGPELWTAAFLLGIAWLMTFRGASIARSALILIVSTMAIACHPFAIPACLALLFCSMAQSRPDGPRVVGGRIWLGWFDSVTLCAAIGGLALFALLWSPDGSFLWHRISDLYRESHPPLRIGGQTWIQGVDLRSPPWWTTPVLLFLTTPLPFVVASLIGVGVRIRGRDTRETCSLVPLSALGLVWLFITILQGSPFAGGQDHRIILLALLAPFIGPGLRALESLVEPLARRSQEKLSGISSRVSSIQRPAWVFLNLILFLSLIGQVPSTLAGKRRGANLAPSPERMTERGLSMFHRPVLDAHIVTQVRALPAGARVSCSPWEDTCHRELLPGLLSIGLLPKEIVASKTTQADYLIIPNDPTYATPASLLQQYGATSLAITNVRRGSSLIYGLRARPGSGGR